MCDLASAMLLWIHAFVQKTSDFAGKAVRIYLYLSLFAPCFSQWFATWNKKYILWQLFIVNNLCLWSFLSLNIMKLGTIYLHISIPFYKWNIQN